jgi:hypothetical protein
VRPVKLAELDARFVRHEADRLPFVDTLAEAQGVWFMCPECQHHYVLCWFRGRGVPDDATPGPGRWDPTGTGLHDLTLSPSVLLPSKEPGECNWHGWVKNGDAT